MYLSNTGEVNLSSVLWGASLRPLRGVNKLTYAKFQGAPLPWQYDGDSGVLRDSEGKTICDLWITSEFSGCTTAIHGALMSTAPELLQALQNLLSWVSKDKSLENSPQLKAAENVITKALNWEAER